jgi:hypothetical protein
MILRSNCCRPFHGLAIQFNSDPGACAQGFMLPAASQAKTGLLVQSQSTRLALEVRLASARFFAPEEQNVYSSPFVSDSAPLGAACN